MNTPVPAGFIVVQRWQGRLILKRVSQVLEEHRVVDAEFLGGLQIKEIDGFTADLLHRETIKPSPSKIAAITRLNAQLERLEMVKQPVPVTAMALANRKAKLKREENWKKKIFTFTFDPSNPRHVEAYRNIAPQGRVVILAGTGCPCLPETLTTNQVRYPDLGVLFERSRESFDTCQPPMRIFRQYRPILVDAGILTITGPSSKTSCATNKYIYSFSVADGATLEAVCSTLPPLGVALLKSILKGRFGVVEIQGHELRAVLKQALEEGLFETTMAPFRVFQLYQQRYINAGVLRVRVPEPSTTTGSGLTQL